MKKSLFVVVAVVMLIIQSCSKKGNEYRLYYLGGQSNMDGYGFVAELPASLAGEMDGIMIYHGNTQGDNTPVDGRGLWSTLCPGHGAGFV